MIDKKSLNNNADDNRTANFTKVNNASLEDFEHNLK